ncbi:hypothetical protein ACIRD2_34015 [Streptomyces sp. NPDC093595]|uniref:hypothetical protein n=1 Tax=Streptomyces sp. NPDC093595 TaxID=3366045 RepID=UPI00382D15FE
MIRNKILGLTLAVATAAVLAPNVALAEDPNHQTPLAQCTSNNGTPVSVSQMIARLKGNAPIANDNSYQDLSQAKLDDLAAGVGYLLNGQSNLALPKLTSAGFSACWASMVSSAGSDTVLIYDRDALFTDADGNTLSNGRSFMVFKRGETWPTNPINLSVPHTVDEANISEMASAALRDQPQHVYSAVFSGVDRCNSTTNSDDNGTTSECNNHYKKSDMAHRWDNTSTTVLGSALTDFQVMHDELRQYSPDSFNLQLHGMGGTDSAGFEMSNSNPNATNGSLNDAVARAHQAYSAALLQVIPTSQTAERTKHTTCTAYQNSAGVDVAITDRSPRRCGVNSDQGQRDRADGNGDRWLHLEISTYIRANHRDAIQNAFAAIRDE